MDRRICAACDRPFEALPHVPRQAYCDAKLCQLARRRRWQQAKRLTDPDYVDNQRNAQKAWSRRNPDYWREYRHANPDYADRNRAQQRARGRTMSLPEIAKIDVPAAAPALRAGLYIIEPIASRKIAKRNLWTTEITWVSGLTRTLAARCKERT